MKIGAASLALLLATSFSAGAVDLKLTRKSADGATAQVCVTLDSEGQSVAGTQNDLSWNAGCASLEAAKCVASAHHKKPLHGSIPKSLQSTYRSLVFALDNVDPMADGEIYCCTFDIKGSSDSCCAVEITRIGASDPQGNALDTSATPEEVCLLGDQVPPAAPAPAAEAPSEPEAGPNWIWIAAFAAVVLVVLFLALRKAS
jgi:hypothetical protein